MSELWTLQCMMFVLVAAGMILKRKGILKDEGKAVLTDVVLYFFMPCNIINSFRMEFDLEILQKFAVVLGNGAALTISALRLVILPLMVLLGCKLFHVDELLTGVCVLITGMPAGSTSAILAAKYGCVYSFATKCIVVSTLLSMLTIPLWCMAL